MPRAQDETHLSARAELATLLGGMGLLSEALNHFRALLEVSVLLYEALSYVCIRP